MKHAPTHFSVALSEDHPGLHDREYRMRRDAIAALASVHVPGAPPAFVDYTDEEQATWQTIWRHLRPAHAQHACLEVRRALASWAPWEGPIPQLAGLDAPGGPLDGTGFTFEPVSGLVPSRDFFATLAGGVFRSTQYMRHPSRPLYTPEPDLVHELIGHAGTFSIPGVAQLSRAFGAAAERASAEVLEEIERLYWFAVEFGLVLEEGRPKAFGAGLLSSAGELAGIETADLRPFDVAAIRRMPYGTSDLQPTLFVASSLAQLLDETGRALGELQM